MKVDWNAVLEKVIAGLVITSIVGILGGFFQVWRNHDAVVGLRNDMNDIRNRIMPPKAELQDIPERPPELPGGRPGTPPGAGGSIGLDQEATPRYGNKPLQASFLPDPFEQRGDGGGSIDVSYLDGDCIGYARQAPYLRLQWSGETDQLRVFFTADDGEDSSLLIKHPNDSWVCNDDWTVFSLDPVVVLKNPEPGEYNIWVGSYEPRQTITGTLGISELEAEPRPALPFGGAITR